MTDQKGEETAMQISPCFHEGRVDAPVVQAVILMAAELARNGCEGKRVGTMFVLGDEDEVLRRSHPLILDPLKGHPEEAKSVLNPEMRGTIRELALLDGAFVVSSKGVVLSAARCLDVSTNGVQVPLGLGSRHQAAASLTRATDALAVVVSQSSTVRVFHDGRVVDEWRESGPSPQTPSPMHTPTEMRIPTEMHTPTNVPGTPTRRHGPGSAPPLPVKAPPRGGESWVWRKNRF